MIFALGIYIFMHCYDALLPLLTSFRVAYGIYLGAELFQAYVQFLMGTFATSSVSRKRQSVSAMLHQITPLLLFISLDSPSPRNAKEHSSLDSPSPRNANEHPLRSQSF